MIHRAVHIGIVLGVLVHMTCGCCLHHAHGSMPAGDDPAVVDSDACPCGHQHEDQGLPGDHRGLPEPCGGEHCSFTRPESSDYVDFSDALQAPLTISAMPPLAVPGRLDVAELEPQSLALPVPLHLLNQALLL